MRRVLKYLILVIAAAALIACFAGFVWLTQTTDGARWVMATLSRQTGLDISAASVEGKLGDTLHLKQLNIRWSQGVIGVEQVKLSAGPLDLLRGNIRLTAASLKNVSIENNAPEKPPVLQWPKISGIPVWLGAAIDRLDVENLTYIRPGEIPLTFARISASLDWKLGTLTAEQIRIESDFGTASGNLRAGFSRPLLDADVTFAPAHSFGGMDIFHLTGQCTPGKKPEQIAGTLHLTGSTKQPETKPLWELSLDTALTSQGFPLRNIRLIRPGEKGVVNAEGLLSFQGKTPYLTLKAQAKDIDWTSGISVPASLSGTISLAGTVKEYGGVYSITNSGQAWQNVRLNGDFTGNDRSAKINIGKGAVMSGSLAGSLNVDWHEGLSLNADLSGRNLNPAAFDKEWSGQINFDLTGRIQTDENKRPRGEASLQLKESRLHGQSLTGNFRTRFTGDDVLIENLTLQGKGFGIQASGEVKNKLDFTARISDFAKLVPQTAGALSASGWLRYREGKIGGMVSARASGFTANGLTIASADIKASMDDREQAPIDLQATLQKLRYGQFHADSFMLQATGTKENHAALAKLRAGSNEAHITLTGSYEQHEWRGTLSKLEGRDKNGSWRLMRPSGLVLSSSGFTLDPLTISGDTEIINASGKLTYKPLSGSIFLDWKGINLQRLSGWLDQNKLSGATQGTLRLTLLPDNHVRLQGKASFQGAFDLEGKSIGIRQGLLNVDADEKGTHADLGISLSEGGTLRGEFSSSTPAAFALPDDGRFKFHLQDFDPALLGGLIPKPVRLGGKISADANGRLLAEHRLMMTGRVVASESTIQIREQKRDIRINLKDASLDVIWQDDALSGAVFMKLSEYGKLEGRFRLPIAARLPATFDEKGMFQASVTGAVSEKGMLTSLFPGLVQESRGRLDIDLKLSGAWKDPHVEGYAHLSQAGGYLPTAGITVKDAGMNARFAEDKIVIDSIKAYSGQGHVEGSAVIQLKGGAVAGFEGRLDGDHFQTIYFPELQVQSSPKLTFSGTPKKIAVRGEIQLPVVAVRGTPSSQAVEASPDVVRAGKTKSVQKKLPFDLDVQVKVILGDAVSFKSGNIDAQLGGNVDLQFSEIDKVFGRGEIRVTKGRFQTYGVNLDVVRGRLYYTGGAVNQPNLDILAIKTVGDVKAGVTVTGKLPSPYIKLYSDPVMQDTDILAYIVLGHPLGTSTEQANLLAMAAGALFSSRQAEGLQSQIKDRLGLSSFDISTGVVEKNGRMGYKPIKVSPPGTGASSSESIGETMVVVGRYLTPKLYVSYGRSLFSGSNLFSLRYNLSKNWQVESQTGESSGLDIYYKLEFN